MYIYIKYLMSVYIICLFLCFVCWKFGIFSLHLPFSPDIARV